MGSPMSDVRSPKPERRLSSHQWKVLRYIILFVIVTRILLMFRSEARIFTRPFLEDSFYLFNCAEHFAHGEGFTCDSKQPSNGVQPLVVIFYAPLFLIAGADKLLALKLAFILVALFDSLSVIFIARLIRLLQKKPDEESSSWLTPPIVASVLWATLYPIFVHTGSGLETGIYSALLLASLYYYTRYSIIRNEGNPPSLMQWIFLGVVLGLTVLARIDAVFLVIAIASYELFKFKAKGIKSAALLSFFAFIVSSPWWWYNYKFFGSVMPQSGMAESLDSLLAENLRRGAIVIGDILTVFLFLPNYDLPAWFHFFWLFAIAAIVIWLIRKFDVSNFLNRSYSFSSLAPFAAFCGMLIVYYIFFFSAPHFLPRYFHPFRILWLVLFACAAPKLKDILTQYYRQYKRIVQICFVVFSLCAVGFSASRYLYYFVVPSWSDFYNAGNFALQHPNDKIGMEQSGTAGFMASNVVNLDGKVNFAALQAKQRHDIGAYIESEKLDYLADWRDVVDTFLTSASRHGGRFIQVDSIGKILILKRVK